MNFEPICWHEMVDKALFTNILVADAKRWITPNQVDTACGPRISLANMSVLLKIVERRARDFHAALWSNDFDCDLNCLGG